jgi:hypothetical protein
MKYLDLINVINSQSNLPKIDFDHKSLNIVGRDNQFLTETEFNFITETVKLHNLKTGIEVSSDWGLSSLASGLELDILYPTETYPESFKFQAFFNKYYKTNIRYPIYGQSIDNINYVFNKGSWNSLERTIETFGRFLSDNFVIFIHHSDLLTELNKEKIYSSLGYPLTPVFTNSNTDHYDLAYVSPLRI